jgi:hypothetical protein
MGSPVYAPPPAVPAYSLFDYRSVAIATFFGTPLAGTIIMAHNYRRIGKGGAAAAAVIVGLVVTALLLFLSFTVQSDAIRALPIGLLLGTMSAAKSLQGPFVDEHARFGGKIASRWAAFGIGLVILVPILLIIVGEVNSGFANSKVIIGTKDEVRYSGLAKEPDARALGEKLKSIGYLSDRGVTVLLAKDSGGSTVSFVVKEGIWNNQKSVSQFEEIGRQVAPVIGGLPIKLRLLNSSLEVKKEVVIK